MIGVVVASEYLRRAKSRSFIVLTLLSPLLIIGVMAIAGGTIYLSARSDAEIQRTVAVLDESGGVLPVLIEAAEREDSAFRFAKAEASVADAKQAVIDGAHDALLVLPHDFARAGGPRAAAVYLREKQSVTAENALERLVLGEVRRLRLAEFALSQEVQETLGERLALDAVGLTEEGAEEAGSAGAGAAVGMALSGIVMLVMVVYGSLLMQSAMEEKTSRMAEILVSSVRPFELLMGKVLAIGAVALTQIAAWLAMVVCAGLVAGVFLLGEFEPGELAGLLEAAPDGGARFEPPDLRLDVALVVLLMLPLGYLTYASVFAALGAMYETPQEAQLAVTVAMVPVMLMVVMVQTVALAPGSIAVTVGSFFPFTAPAILPTRMLVTEVPWWQVVVSFALCIGTSLGIVWLSGRVFRGSLLIYGQKPKLKDIWRVLRAD